MLQVTAHGFYLINDTCVGNALILAGSAWGQNIWTEIEKNILVATQQFYQQQPSNAQHFRSAIWKSWKFQQVSVEIHPFPVPTMCPIFPLVRQL